MFFHLCEVVQIFQRESIFIIKLVPGGTNFGGSIFTMTGAASAWHQHRTVLAMVHDVTNIAHIFTYPYIPYRADNGTD